jgi:hypothetical protein
MRAGDERGSPEVDGRLRALYRELLRVGRPNPPEPANWYSNAVTAGLHASEDRQHRLLLGARAQIPDPSWALIYFGAALMVIFGFFFHLESRRQLVWMSVAVIVMLTALTGVVSGLDHPTQRPFGVGPDAMRTEQARLGLGLGVTTRAASAAEFRAHPQPDVDERRKSRYERGAVPSIGRLSSRCETPTPPGGSRSKAASAASARLGRGGMGPVDGGTQQAQEAAECVKLLANLAAQPFELRRIASGPVVAGTVRFDSHQPPLEGEPLRFQAQHGSTAVRKELVDLLQAWALRPSAVAREHRLDSFL